MVLSFHYVLLTIEYYKIIENLCSELKDVEDSIQGWKDWRDIFWIRSQTLTKPYKNAILLQRHTTFFLLKTIQKQQHYDVLQWYIKFYCLFYSFHILYSFFFPFNIWLLFSKQSRFNFLCFREITLKTDDPCQIEKVLKILALKFGKDSNKHKKKLSTLFKA